ncbi:MAG: hypothetical protein NVS3B21_17880 [Acidimicrobiales bacterium]
MRLRGRRGQLRPEPTVCDVLRGREMACQWRAGRWLVLDVPTGCGIGLEAFIWDGFPTYLTGPVTPVFEPGERLRYITQVGLDLLEEAKFAAPVVGLGPRIGGVLIDDCRVGRVDVFARTLGPLAPQVGLDDGEAVAFVAEKLSGAGGVHEDAPYPRLHRPWTSGQIFSSTGPHSLRCPDGRGQRNCFAINLPG